MCKSSLIRLIKTGLLIPLSAGLLLSFAGAAWPAETLEITVIVDNLRSSAGRVHIALWRDAAGFTEEEAAVVKAGLPAQRGSVTFKLKGLPPGRYAVASYHDENGDGEFGQTWIGLPDEGLGFSNGAWIFFGPPSFEEAAVEVGRLDASIRVSLRYAEPPAPKRTDRQR